MSPKMKFDVFLSHNSKDKPWVIDLKNALQKYKVKVWLDKDEIRPGDIFAEALEIGLKESKAMALVISPDSMASGWVKNEYYRALSLATNGHLQLIPVLYKKAEVPGFLQDRNWVDFSNELEYVQSVEKLVWGITGERPRKVSSPKISVDQKEQISVNHHKQDSIKATQPLFSPSSFLLRTSERGSVEEIFKEPLSSQIRLFKSTLRDVEEFLDLNDPTRITLGSLNAVKTDILSIMEGFRLIQPTRQSEVYTFVRSIDEVLNNLRMSKVVLFEIESLFEGDKLKGGKSRPFLEKMEECRKCIAAALRAFV